MKTVFSILLLLIFTQGNAQMNQRVVNFHSIVRIKSKYLSHQMMEHYFSSPEVKCLATKERMRFSRTRKIVVQYPAKEKGALGKALSHVYMKNGAAGWMGSWVNNVQLTIGWRYQPLRILTAQQPLPVHPLTMRLRIKI